MSQSPFKTKKFVSLKAKWDQKLLNSGFKDIEDVQRDGTETLKVWDSYFGRNVDFYKEHEIFFQAREEYFRLAGQFFYDHKFDNTLDKELWGYHKDGLSIRQIALILKQRNIDIKKSQVFNRIKKLVDQMIMKHTYVNR